LPGGLPFGIAEDFLFHAAGKVGGELGGVLLDQPRPAQVDLASAQGRQCPGKPASEAHREIRPVLGTVAG
jgi:hypothetical protein